MADISKLQSLLNAYGVGVRAGVITPQTEDEVYFRKLMDLPGMSPAASANWQTTGGVRRPITLVKDEDNGQNQQEP